MFGWSQLAESHCGNKTRLFLYQFSSYSLSRPPAASFVFLHGNQKSLFSLLTTLILELGKGTILVVHVKILIYHLCMIKYSPSGTDWISIWILWHFKCLCKPSHSLILSILFPRQRDQWDLCRIKYSLKKVEREGGGEIEILFALINVVM